MILSGAKIIMDEPPMAMPAIRMIRPKNAIRHMWALLILLMIELSVVWFRLIVPPMQLLVKFHIKVLSRRCKP